MKLPQLTFVFVALATVISQGFVIEIDKERLQEWLKQEYGPIFNKVIMVEPVMQKVGFGRGAKLPSSRVSVLHSSPFQGQKRRNRWYAEPRESPVPAESEEDFSKVFH